MTPSSPHQILIAEDDPVTNNLLQRLLKQEGYDALVAFDGEQAINLVSDDLAVAIIDLRMPRRSGMECLEFIQAEYPLTEVIVISTAGITEAVQAMKHGAFSYIQKPINRDELISTLDRAVQHWSMSQRNAELRQAANVVSGTVDIVGTSEAVTHLKSECLKNASRQSLLLICGEKGSCTFDIARFIHQRSTRKPKPFVAVDFNNIPRDLLEADFFGHAADAYPRAPYSRPGRTEIAHGGTLFLNDIAEVPIEFQYRLSEFLNDRIVQRIGAAKERKVNVRVICSTRHNLKYLQKEGVIIPDLFQALSRRVITVPPLRTRKSDIPFIVESYLHGIRKRDERPRLKLSDAARNKLLEYEWPGNIQQLENVLERAALFCKKDEITVQDTKFQLIDLPEQHEGDESCNATLEEIEYMAIKRTLAKVGGNKTQAALNLGISVKTIYNKMKRFGLDPDEGAAKV